MPIPTPVFLTSRNLAFADPSETVAVGYGNANMTMVVGTGGVILIDSLENAEAAREVLAHIAPELPD